MRTFHKFVLSLMLSCGFFTSAPVGAQVTANATTNVVINFPEILILYTFSTITLTLDKTFIQGNLGLGTIAACGTGGGCVNAGTTSKSSVNATTDLDIASDADVLGSNMTSITLTLQNALGARSLGLTDTNYTLGVVDGANTEVLGLDGTQPTSFANTGLALSTSDLVLLIDPSEIDTQAESVSVNEDFVITVSGT